jgi:hypothetical protein
LKVFVVKFMMENYSNALLHGANLHYSLG